MAEQDIEHPDKYEMVTASLFDNVYGQLSVAWNEYLGSYVICHIGDLFDDPRTLYIRISDKPEGPFSDPIRICGLNGELGEDFDRLFSCPYLHPELFRNDGEIMCVTSCINPKEAFSNPRLTEFRIKKNQL